MTSEDFERRILEWANLQPEVDALIQIGSRAQRHGEVDVWSDWDYHLVVRDPKKFVDGLWLSEIAPCWSSHVEVTERAVAKVSAIFAGGYEADFVPLASWQMKLVYWAMARPGLSPLYPKVLVRGIANTQLIARPGYKILKGGSAWEERMSALAAIWPKAAFSSDDFANTVAGFWRHVVWVAKKIMRGEGRAAQRWFFREVVERRWLLLEEEARCAGKFPRPEARKAEKWLDGKRLEQTSVEGGTDKRALARDLLAEIALFEDLSVSLAKSRGFEHRDYAAVAGWLRTELRKLANPN